MKGMLKSAFSYVFIALVVVVSSVILSGASDIQVLNRISPLYETLYRINYDYYGIKDVDYDKIIDSAGQHGKGLMMILAITHRLVQEQQIEWKVNMVDWE